MGFRRARFWSIRNTNATATAWSLSTISPRAHAFRYHSCITLGFIVGVKPCGDLLGIGFVLLESFTQICPGVRDTVSVVTGDVTDVD